MGQWAGSVGAAGPCGQLGQAWHSRESFQGERVAVAAAGTAFSVAVTEGGQVYDGESTLAHSLFLANLC